MLRAILDTNILVSAIAFGGLPLTLLKQATDTFELVVSEEILTEFTDVLQEPKIEGKTHSSPEDRIEQRDRIARVGTVVSPLATVPIFESDPKDTHLLALAATARTDYLVTGDKALLALGTYEGTCIVTARAFLDVLAREAEHGGAQPSGT